MPTWMLCLLLVCAAVSAAEMPRDKQWTNSLGMRFARIERGSFRMGAGDKPLPRKLAGRPWRQHGDPDEHPAHLVAITRPFYIAVTEVTNAQYERFDPKHRALRGKMGFSKDDDEAVVFVSWHDAAAFCRWLSKKEGLPYRLPTEAEWEYACRAGTTTPFHTGDALPGDFHKNARESWYPDPRRATAGQVVPLHVAKTPPNAWGLHDMHGNVEEWCLDWYGPYQPGEATDPVGYADGDFKVTRGGSHSTELYFLRSANRSGTLPEDRSWLIGFRVVIGEMPKGKPLPPPEPPLHQRNVKQELPADIAKGPDPDKPYFKGPRVYVKVPPNSFGPMFSTHNHDPAITDCPNGDLLAIWYSCVREPGRELAILASRLRRGAEEWEPASVFWDAPDRNDHAPALWFDGKDTLYHFNGLSAAATWGSLATILRTSKDGGATWSKARIILPEHRTRQMPIESVFRTREGWILLPCDAVSIGHGGTAVYLSRDEGATWHDAGGTAAGQKPLDGHGQDVGLHPEPLPADLERPAARAAAPARGADLLRLVRTQHRVHRRRGQAAKRLGPFHRAVVRRRRNMAGQASGDRRPAPSQGARHRRAARHHRPQPRRAEGLPVRVPGGRWRDSPHQQPPALRLQLQVAHHPAARRVIGWLGGCRRPLSLTRRPGAPILRRATFAD